MSLRHGQPARQANPERRCRLGWRNGTLAFASCLALWILAARPAHGQQQPAAPVRLCVLNFANRSLSGEWQWLSKGLCDMLITDLSSCSRLQLVEREKMQMLFDELRLQEAGLVQPSSAALVGRTARVDQVLFGSFLKSGDNLDVEAHIVDVATGELLNVQRVAGKADAVFSLEKELALNIVNRLDVRPTEVERQSILRLSTDSVDAATRFYEGMDLYDKGEYEKAFVRVRAAVAKDPRYAEARHWAASIYYSLAEVEHAICDYRRCVALTDDGHWTAESAYSLANAYELNLGDEDRALQVYRELTGRFPGARRARDAWHRIQDLLVARQDWLGAFETSEHTGDLPLRSMRAELYERVLATHGDVVPPPDYVTVLTPEEPAVLSEAPFPYNALEGYTCLKAAGGYQLDALDVEVRGHCNEFQPKSKYDRSYISLEASARFPPGGDGRPPMLEITSKQDSVQKAHVDLPAGTMTVWLHFSNVHASADYWRATARLGPYDKNAPARQVKPLFNKTRPQLNEYSVGIPVTRKGFAPSAVEDRKGTLWVVYNDVGEWGADPGLLTGSFGSLWLVRSDDGWHWTSPYFLPFNSAAPEYSASLCAAEDGRLWLAWISQRGPDEAPKIWISSSYDGRRWSHPRKVAVGGPDDMLGLPRLFQDRQGTLWLVYAAWQGDRFWRRAKVPLSARLEIDNVVGSGFPKLFIASSRDAVSWTEPQAIPDAHAVQSLAALRDSHGVFRVATARFIGGIHIHSSPDGVRWTRTEYEFQAEGRPEEEAIGYTFPDLVELPGGALLLTYQPSSRGLEGALSHDGKSWERLGAISTRDWTVGCAAACVQRRAGDYCLVCGWQYPTGGDMAVELSGRTLLHAAAAGGRTGAARILLATRFDVNAADKFGRTPLHLAAMNGCTEVAELLLAKGADPRARDGKGKTPLALATEGGHRDVVQLLTEHDGKE